MIPPDTPTKTQKPYLVTTALEEFWETSEQLLFLGEWCTRFSRKSFWQSLGGEVLESPWNNRQNISDARGYVSGLYERLLPITAQALNKLHGVSFSAKYWRIVIGPWLQVYVSTVYDRYLSLRNALIKYPDLTTTVLSANSFVTPQDTMSFLQYLKEDPYNLQIFTRILRLLGKEFPEKSLTVSAMPFFCSDKNNLGKMKHHFLKLLFRINRALKEGHSVVLRSSYFSADAQIQFALRTCGRIWSVVGDTFDLPVMEINHAAREQISRYYIGNNEFEELLCEMISKDIPVSFVEGFSEIGHNVKNDYPSAPKAIMSAVGWYFDETFKQWAAEASENGSQLLGMQHGGNYGCLAFNGGEEHEIAITDRYYTWGWERFDFPEKVFPGSAAKIVGRKTLGASNEKEGILFVATSAFRYFREFPMLPQDFSDYLVRQRAFIASFSSSLLPVLRVRMHREDYGWDMEKRWREFCPDVRFEEWSTALTRSLENCRLYVSDHLATTYIEALSADKPTILFWNPASYEFRPEAQPFFDQLRSAGILFDSPEAAAEMVNSVYGDVETWWNESVRQAARQAFCKRFARVSSQAVKKWLDEFKGITQDVGIALPK